MNKKKLEKKDEISKIINENSIPIKRVAYKFFENCVRNNLYFVDKHDVFQDLVEIMILKKDKWNKKKYTIFSYLNYCKWILLNKYNSCTIVGKIPRNLKTSYLRMIINEDDDVKKKLDKNKNLTNLRNSLMGIVADTNELKEIKSNEFENNIKLYLTFESIIKYVNKNFNQFEKDVLFSFFKTNNKSFEEISKKYKINKQRLYIIKNSLINMLKEKRDLWLIYDL